MATAGHTADQTGTAEAQGEGQARGSSLATDEALDIIDGALGVGGRLVLGSITDQALAVCEGDIGGSNPVALQAEV